MNLSGDHWTQKSQQILPANLPTRIHRAIIPWFNGSTIQRFSIQERRTKCSELLELSKFPDNDVHRRQVSQKIPLKRSLRSAKRLERRDVQRQKQATGTSTGEINNGIKQHNRNRSKTRRDSKLAWQSWSALRLHHFVTKSKWVLPEFNLYLHLLRLLLRRNSINNRDK